MTLGPVAYIVGTLRLQDRPADAADAVMAAITAREIGMARLQRELAAAASRDDAWAATHRFVSARRVLLR